jgi:hypothetical protein
MELRFSLTIDNGVEDTITPIMTALATRAVSGFTEGQQCCIEKLEALGGAFNELLPVDLFQDESVELNRQLKDLQDLSTIWTDYTQSFQIPASDTNNLIFADWFDENIVLGGWNPNVGKNATLYIHSLPVYNGRVEFIGCKFKDGIPQLYNIVFYGTTKKILDVWGEDLMNEDMWSAYDHTANYTNILASWNQTLVNGDILWPIADYNQNWRYSTASGINGNIRNPNGVEVDDLRPAIRLKAMLTTVFAYAGYTLSGSFLTRPEMDDAYILPMQNAGPLYDPEYVASGLVTAYVNAFTYTQFTSAMLNYQTIIFPTVATNPSGNYNLASGIYTANRKGNYSFEMSFYVQFNSPVAGQVITFVVMLNGRVMKSRTITTNVNTFISPAYLNFDYMLTSGDEVSYGYRTTTANVSTPFTMSFECTVAPQGINGNTIDMKDAMPQTKIKDFVNGVIKAYNCILIPTSSNTIEIHNLQDWYALGTTKNWSPFIDIKDIEHDKLPIPKVISMTHKESQCLASEYYRNINRREYGSIEFSPVIDYPTDEFKLETPFNVICPQTLEETNANNQKVRSTELNIPRFMDKDNKAVQQDLTLFYYGGLQSISDPYYFNNNGTPVNQYVLPLMTSYSAYPTITSSYSMAFGLEYSVRGDAPVNSLYNMYWIEYLSRMYSTQSRLVKMTGIIPVGEWLNFELNDTIAISGNYYKVQSVKYDMLTEIANLELITYPDVDIMSFTTTGQKPDFTDVVVNVNGKSYLQDYVVAKGIMNSYRFGTQDYLDTNQDTTYNQNSVSDLAQQVDSLQAIVQFNQITMYRSSLSGPLTTDATIWLNIPMESQVSIGYVQNITATLSPSKYICTDGGQYKFTAMVEIEQSGNHHSTVAILVNGIQTTGYGAIAVDYGIVNFSTILDLSTTDEVTLAWKPRTGGSRTIYVTNANFLILKK